MCVCVCALLYHSQVEEGHRVTWVGVVGPAFLTRVEELHVPDLSFAFRNKTPKNDVFNVFKCKMY